MEFVDEDTTKEGELGEVTEDGGGDVAGVDVGEIDKSGAGSVSVGGLECELAPLPIIHSFCTR